MSKPASDKQINFMKSLGINVPDNCTMSQAKSLIDEKLNNKSPKGSTFPSNSTSNQLDNAPLGQSNKDKSIIRQSSMNRAVELVSAGTIALDQMFDWAEKIEQWVNR